MARLEKAIAELADRVTALECKTPSKPEAPKPTEDLGEAAAQQVFAEMVQRQSQGAIDLIAFTKTDGLPSKESGVQYYTLSFEGTIRCNYLGVWSFMPAFESELKFNFVQAPRNQRSLDAQMFYGINPGLRTDRGTRFKLTGKLIFERAERGWRLIRAVKTDVDQVR